MKFLWTDGKTGKFSGTTLRTWLLFIVCMMFALALFVYYSLAFFEIFKANENWANQLNDLFGTLAFAAFGGGGLYLGKRVVENIHTPHDTENTALVAKRKTGGSRGL